MFDEIINNKCGETITLKNTYSREIAIMQNYKNTHWTEHNYTDRYHI